MMRALLVSALFAMVLAGCWVASVEGPDPAEIPNGPPDALLGGPEPLGPIVVVGRGRSEGIGWHYSIYESADGMSGGDGPVALDGVVSDAVAELWVETADGQ